MYSPYLKNNNIVITIDDQNQSVTHIVTDIVIKL